MVIVFECRFEPTTKTIDATHLPLLPPTDKRGNRRLEPRLERLKVAGPQRLLAPIQRLVQDLLPVLAPAHAALSLVLVLVLAFASVVLLVSVYWAVVGVCLWVCGI